MKFAARRDGAHGPIREGLRGVPGCSVLDSSHIGNGWPDLMALYCRAGTCTFRMFEIKNPGAPPSKAKLRPVQEKFREKFAPVYRVVTTLDEAMRELGIT
jgi:hypothetical protein